jgi:Cys-rich repeat protein
MTYGMKGAWRAALLGVAVAACGGSDGTDVADRPDATWRCTSSADCEGAAGGPVCAIALGECVPCTDGEDVCPLEQHCVQQACVPGCDSDDDCPDAARCDIAATDPTCVQCLVDTDCGDGEVCDDARTCVGCVDDDDCALGSVCDDTARCVPGCTPEHGCAGGLACCDGTCTDLLSDPASCGACDDACEVPNATALCDVGFCVQGACDADWADCNGGTSDGCEHDVVSGGPCLCVPGETQSCYEGEPATLDVGTCAAGAQMCDGSGLAWEACEGQILPVLEVCGDGLDNDCDGSTDENVDVDGDGWGTCEGDCNDNNDQVNPGAFEVPADGVNNDCFGGIDDTSTCPGIVNFTGVTPLTQANAMDICQSTTANPPRPQRKWGLLSASFLHANGTTPSAAQMIKIQSSQTSVFGNFGLGLPTTGTTMAGISTGKSRDPGDPGWVSPVTGTDQAHEIAFPTTGTLGDYLAVSGGQLNLGQCAGAACPPGAKANDSVMLRLQLRVPTNARGFSYDLRFFTSDYQAYQCSAFNDTFLALLTSSAAGLRLDRNITVDGIGGAINANTDFLTVCGGNADNCRACPYGTSALLNTGFDTVSGGATPWLTTTAPVVPGETITLNFLLFDVGDGTFDSQVLLDGFRWLTTPTTNTTVVRP